MNAFLRLAHGIENILEDGYIESKILNRYPGVLGHSLEASRAHQYETMSTLTQLIEGESENSHIWLSITSLILSYVKFGEIKYGDEPISDERLQAVFSLIAELDRALTDPSARERWNITNIIIIRLWNYIKDFLEYCEKLADEAEASEDGVGGILGALLSALAGASEEAKGSTAPAEEAKGIPSSPASVPVKRAATAKKAAASVKKPDEEKSEKEKPEAGTPEDDDPKEEKPGEDSIASPENKGDPEPGEVDEADATGDLYEDRNIPSGTDADSSPSNYVSDKEGGRIPLTQTDDVSSPTGGETTRDDDYSGSGYANSAADIDRLLDNMAEKAAAKQLETERSAELNDLAKAVSYGNIHKGLDTIVHRMPEVEDNTKEQYNLIASPLVHISKLLQRSILQQLKDKRSGGKQTGLLMGRRLDAHALPRNDGRVFYKNALPNQIPELAVGLLVDESGSMSCGERATYARATAIILYDFCRSLGIPVMVYGHSTKGSAIALYSYAEFDDIDGNDRYRMMDISSRCNNRDGAALRYVSEQLSRRTEEVKILILISDGQPADNGYYGTAAEEDLRGVKAEYSKRHIIFVAAAIGDDKEAIQRIYGDSFLDITDLNKLPVALTNVVKRHIRL
ncbi:MAG: nitric oxide reductase activation protein NorD [Clostridiales bacterium]|jgi:cobalamin biosynthesis protein CobT|nr:nitric oxide reductase activation protein NorD [Clostridiales bacterium]